MTGFIRRHLSPADQLGEVLFGLIMALGFTGSVRLGLEEPDNRELFVGILGCNTAWAIVDGAMYVLGELFERGRRSAVIRRIQSTPDDDDAVRIVADEVEGLLGFLEPGTADEGLHPEMLRLVRSGKAVEPGLRREDLLGGAAVALAIVLATLPVVFPYLVIPNPDLAVRVSNGVALSMLVLLGTAWGRGLGGGAWRIGVALLVIGILLVLITIALGG